MDHVGAPTPKYWRELAGAVGWEGIALSGYYNRNYRIGSSVGEVVIRIPIPDAPTMDVVRIPEFAAQRLASAGGVPTPEIIYHDDYFSVLEYITGRTLRRTIDKYGLTDDLLRAWIGLLVASWRVDPAPLRKHMDRWVEWEDTRSLWHAVSNQFAAVWRQHEQWLPLLERFNVPLNALDRVGGWIDDLHPRSWVFSHGDLHGANVIVANRFGDEPHLVAIDWQLAIVGDPAMEVGFLLNRLRLNLRDEGRFVEELGRQWPDAATPEFIADCQRWRGLELVKSLIVDSVRCWRAVNRLGLSDTERAAAAELLHDRLTMTSTWWGQPRWPLHAVVEGLLEFVPE